MIDNMDFECLSLSEQVYDEEAIGKAMTSLMSMVRVKYEFGSSVMEISEILLQEPSNFESSKEEQNVYDLRNESEAEKRNDALIQSNIEVFSNALARRTDLKKRPNKAVMANMKLQYTEFVVAIVGSYAL
ncbi:hypothetical protein G6F37_005287 [Rhizopus arrhizus]|nr:hypothetical protein G6F38_001100 [Rhizopus arrhizus]KAG1159005.1 hypothetical protein G6F37_005287 [Rhizopus arrhizus]